MKSNQMVMDFNSYGGQKSDKGCFGARSDRSTLMPQKRTAEASSSFLYDIFVEDGATTSARPCHKSKQSFNFMPRSRQLALEQANRLPLSLNVTSGDGVASGTMGSILPAFVKPEKPTQHGSPTLVQQPCSPFELPPHWNRGPLLAPRRKQARERSPSRSPAKRQRREFERSCSSTMCGQHHHRLSLRSEAKMLLMNGAPAWWPDSLMWIDPATVSHKPSLAFSPPPCPPTRAVLEKGCHGSKKKKKNNDINKKKNGKKTKKKAKKNKSKPYLLFTVFIY